MVIFPNINLLFTYMVIPHFLNIRFRHDALQEKNVDGKNIISVPI